MTTLVKICGICSSQAANDAVRAGADYLGLVFANNSKRCVELSQAMEIANTVKNRCKLVGVFQDADSDFINRTTELLDLDMVQLHGTESPDLCDCIFAPIIKVINIDIFGGKDHSLLDLSHIQDQISMKIRHFKNHCKYFLFDRPKNLKNHASAAGYLETVVQAICELEFKIDYFIAGGLNLSNLPHVLEKLQPFGVDVASGVEREPRVKDYHKMQLFCNLVHRYSAAPVGHVLGGEP